MNKVSPDSSPREYIPPLRISDANASAVDATARNRLSQPPSPTTERLASAEKNHPLLSNFYDKIKQGDLLEGDLARDLFNEALKMIEGRSEPKYLLPRALGTMHLASTFAQGSQRNDYSLKALDQTFKAYDQKEALFFVNDQAKLKALHHFSRLFTNLIPLFPSDSPILPEIQKKLSECQLELARRPKITKEPVDPWKVAKLFLAFGFAAAVIAGAFVLGRRYITQLSK